MLRITRRKAIRSISLSKLSAAKPGPSRDPLLALHQICPEDWVGVV
jgi:hypothetical protein